ncbi:hypothetical protein XSR1_80107 [Xenorhabdus szentirmaii DSM 16338]|uniref:Uncharacterized protein n=1 Tax=Xenorhabdus szentirmaii DSM 16338 TaxID=1427518 RepID=W1J4F3_9GAMM|nr:hypothetical protein XSR1_80107 [Xenorhabdus szentirmaii DSM 16338]
MGFNSSSASFGARSHKGKPDNDLSFNVLFLLGLAGLCGVGGGFSSGWVKRCQHNSPKC